MLECTWLVLVVVPQWMVLVMVPQGVVLGVLDIEGVLHTVEALFPNA